MTNYKDNLHSAWGDMAKRPQRVVPKENAEYPVGITVLFDNKEWVVTTAGETTLFLTRDDEVTVVIIGEDKVKKI